MSSRLVTCETFYREDVDVVIVKIVLTQCFLFRRRARAKLGLYLFV